MEYIFNEYKDYIELLDYIGTETVVYVPKTIGIHNKKIKKIKSLCFYNKNIKKLIIDDIETIESCAIIDCESLKTITLNNIKYLSEHFIEGCNKNLNIIIKQNNLIKTKDYWINVVSEKEKTANIKYIFNIKKEVIIPDYINGYKIIGINDKVFKNNKIIRKIQLPLYLKQINDFQFLNCSKLKEVIVNDYCQRFGISSFRNSSLEIINCPKNLKVIDDMCFESSMLKDFRCNEELIKIGDKAFSKINNNLNFSFPKKYCCLTLGEEIFRNTLMENIEIPDYIEEIPSGMFLNCFDLINFNSNNIKKVNKQSFYNCFKIILNNSFFENLKYIGPSAFEQVKIDKLFINKDSELSNDSFMNSKVKEVIFHDNYSYNFIPENCFHHCLKLNHVKLSNNIKILKKHCFSDSTLNDINLEFIEVFEEGVFCNSHIKKIYISKNVKNLGKNMCSHSLLEELTFDENCEITYIPENAFLNCNIKNIITFPKYIDKINECAFEGLKSEYINFNDNLSYIDKEAFSKSNLKQIIFPINLKIISFKAFAYTKYLDTVYFNKNLEIMNIGCFQESHVTNLINLEETKLTKISGKCFFNSNIQNINFPKTIVELDIKSFYNCKNLNKIYIHENIKNINNECFSESKIKNLTFNENCFLNIGNKAFYKCFIQKELFLPKIDSLGCNVFSFNGDLTLLHLNTINRLGLKNFEYDTLEIFISDKDLKNKIKSRKFFKNKFIR